jgi:hypothetical protein
MTASADLLLECVSLGLQCNHKIFVCENVCEILGCRVLAEYRFETVVFLTVAAQSAHLAVATYGNWGFGLGYAHVVTTFLACDRVALPRYRVRCEILYHLVLCGFVTELDLEYDWVPLL